MEHSVYSCEWSRSVEGWTLWVRLRPELRARGATYAEAEENLIEAIQDAGGAMHVVFEFVAPLPKSHLEARYTAPELYLVVGEDCFETNAPRAHAFETSAERKAHFKWADRFFEKPICRRCASATGSGNERPLSLRNGVTEYDGAFGHIGVAVGTTPQVLSDRFLELSHEDERNRLKVRPAESKSRANRVYELAGSQGPPFVAVAGLPMSGWRCNVCENRTWGYWVEDVATNSFDAKSELPRPLPGVFPVGVPPEVRLCVTADRCQQLVGRKGTRGLVTTLLGVVPDDEVVRQPDLPTLEERLRESRKRVP